MPPSDAHPPPTLDDVVAAEEELVFDGFDNDAAVELGLQLVSSARAAALPVTIDIRRGDQQLFHAALPGTSADNDGWAERKARAVQRFGKSSLRLRLECEADGTTLEERFMLPPFQYAAHGGSFPVAVRGTGVVGAVTVSGLPQLEDHRFVVEQLRAFLARG